jgi:hypothetical protein
MLNGWRHRVRGGYAGIAAGRNRDAPATGKIGQVPIGSIYGVFWCCRTGLNCRPLPYQGNAFVIYAFVYKNDFFGFSFDSTVISPNAGRALMLSRWRSELACG